MVPAALSPAAPQAMSLPRKIIFPAGAEHVFALVLALIQRVLSLDTRRSIPGRAQQPDRAEGQAPEPTEHPPPIRGCRYALGEAIEASPFHESISPAPPQSAADAVFAMLRMATTPTPSWKSSS
jgi:hypothetical protein